jgi:hypothetical protein
MKKNKKHETWDRLQLIIRNFIEMGGGGRWLQTEMLLQVDTVQKS